MTINFDYCNLVLVAIIMEFSLFQIVVKLGHL